MSTLKTTQISHPSSASNNIVLNSDGSTTIAAPSNIIKSGTAVASTSGTAIDFTDIPSWVKRITVMLDGVSGSGTDAIILQIGDSGGIETTDYAGQRINVFDESSINVVAFSNHFTLTAGGTSNSAANLFYGTAVLNLLTGNTWACNFTTTVDSSSTTARCTIGSGTKTLSSTLDRVRVSLSTNTFDAGTINILYEG